MECLEIPALLSKQSKVMFNLRADVKYAFGDLLDTSSETNRNRMYTFPDHTQKMTKKKKGGGVRGVLNNQILPKAGCIEIKCKRIETSPTIVIIRTLLQHCSQCLKKPHSIKKPGTNYFTRYTACSYSVHCFLRSTYKDRIGYAEIYWGKCLGELERRSLRQQHSSEKASARPVERTAKIGH